MFRLFRRTDLYETPRKNSSYNEQIYGEKAIDSIKDHTTERKKSPVRHWHLPSVSLLSSTNNQSIQTYPGEVIANKLLSFGISCSYIRTQTGPQVVSYDFRLSSPAGYNPAKLKRAVEFIGMDLHAPAYIEQSQVGHFAVVLGRYERSTVTAKDAILASGSNDRVSTSIVLGLDTTMNPVCVDMAKAPHLLIAGTTGSGKSVLLNSILVSSLLRNTPTTAQYLLIDPKQVEMSAYEGLPHLFAPIAKGADAAVKGLKMACDEMDRRYSLLANRGIRSLEEAPGLFPRLYVVIDELADLMMTSKKAVEAFIVRIAQLGRAAGVHLIVATQRPSAQILTGLIRANIPCKVALTVSSATDSVTILGHGGAEKLLGRGDAILKTADSIHETRFQSAYTSDEDLFMVVNHWKTQK